MFIFEIHLFKFEIQHKKVGFQISFKITICNPTSLDFKNKFFKTFLNRIIHL
jgi:hypothetical protein